MIMTALSTLGPCSQILNMDGFRAGACVGVALRTLAHGRAEDAEVPPSSGVPAARGPADADGTACVRIS